MKFLLLALMVTSVSALANGYRPNDGTARPGNPGTIVPAAPGSVDTSTYERKIDAINTGIERSDMNTSPNPVPAENTSESFDETLSTGRVPSKESKKQSQEESVEDLNEVERRTTKPILKE